MFFGLPILVRISLRRIKIEEIANGMGSVAFTVYGGAKVRRSDVDSTVRL